MEAIFYWMIPLELYYHQKNMDRIMFNAADRLKKAIAESTALGFHLGGVQTLFA